MNDALPIRVVGIGSRHGDDAAGWEVVHRLRRRCGDLKHVEYHTLAGGQRLLELLDGRGTLFLIDAVHLAHSSEPYVRLEWPSPRLEQLSPGTTHDMNPAEALKLAECLGLLPPRVVIWGVPITELKSINSLTSRAEAATSKLVAALRPELSCLDFPDLARQN